MPMTCEQCGGEAFSPPKKSSSASGVLGILILLISIPVFLFANIIAGAVMGIFGLLLGALGGGKHIRCLKCDKRYPT